MENEKGLKMFRVLVTPSSFDPALVEKLKQKGFEVVVNPLGRTLTENENEEMVERYNPIGIIAGVEPITARVLKKAAQLKVISRCGIGMENVDLEAAKKQGIQVCNTPDASTQAVAELTIALILNLIRRINEADRNIRAGIWNKLMGRLLGEMAVGIIGCGRIGSKVAEYLKPFGCRIVGADKFLKKHKDIPIVALAELLKIADVITLHVPLTKDTLNMVNHHFINLLKTGSFIINASRGDIIDEEALFEGLVSGKITAAALDTFKNEPYVGPLTQLENVLLTTHIGSYAQEARIKMELDSVNNLLKVLEA